MPPSKIGLYGVKIVGKVGISRGVKHRRKIVRRRLCTLPNSKLVKSYISLNISK